MRKRKPLVVLAGLAVIIAVVVVMGRTFQWYYTRPMPLPEPDQVVAMHVKVWADHFNPIDRESDVPAEHFSPILAALHPYRANPQPLPWVAFAYLDLTLQGGEHYYIGIDSTEEGNEAAFAAGTAGTMRSWRGGTDAGIKAAIRAVCP